MMIMYNERVKGIVLVHLGIIIIVKFQSKYCAEGGEIYQNILPRRYGNNPCAKDDICD